MKVGFQTVTMFVFVFLVIGVATARAQGASTPPPPAAAGAPVQSSPSWGDLTVSLARLDYDLSGVGTAPALAVRMTRDLSPHVSLEFGGVYAKPEQQFGPSTLFMPEALLRYRWNVGRVSPYVGGGIGAALVKSSFHSDWDQTMSAAGGVGVRLTERLGLSGEFRLRGHEWGFASVTSEISGGLTWRLPAFSRPVAKL